ncbi:MAG: hypothetical protein SAJ37_17550, partial [Oscillatoria sp. PMC 1068.18]|nr:hypothetical protein [Oscillatoria sp. PMC 1068.18]
MTLTIEQILESTNIEQIKSVDTEFEQIRASLEKSFSSQDADLTKEYLEDFQQIEKIYIELKKTNDYRKKFEYFKKLKKLWKNFKAQDKKFISQDIV